MDTTMDRETLGGRDVLDRMKAEDGHIGNPTHFTAAIDRKSVV